MTAEFDLHSSSYDVLTGAVALRQIASDLTGHVADEPISAQVRDSMVFIISMMAEKAEACASAWIDDIETRWADC